MRVWKYSIAAALVIAWLAPATSSAQSKAAQEKAKEHYKRAVAYEDLKDWDKAIAEYEQANKLHPDAEFHFLIAEVYVNKGDYKAALERYRKYLAADPRGRVSEKARAQIKKYEPIVAAEEKARQKKLEEERRKKAEEERKRTEAQTTPPPDSTKTNTTTTESTPEPNPTPTPTPIRDDTAPSKPGSGLKIAGLSTAGVGVVALGVGIVFGLSARSAQSDVEEKFDPARFDEGESANTKMKIFVGVGAAAIAGGAALFVLGTRSGGTEDSSAVGIAPSVAPDGVGLVVRGGF